MLLVYNESRKSFVSRTNGLTYGVISVTEGILEFGWFDSLTDENVVIQTQFGTYPIRKESAGVDLYFNRLTGYYTLEPVPQVGFGSGNFPYTFSRYYSTRYLEKSFESYHNIGNNIAFQYLEEFPYTFGLEFETHSGYIPQDLVLKTGLIPLRDGSINGLEYSTIVLKGNDGFNTLKKMVDVLKEYTIFDKECSLHLHLGTWNLKPDVIIRLNNLFATSTIGNYLVPFAFKTARYKANGKDYCRLNDSYRSFDDLYYTLVGRKYLGDLHQPHPSDASGDQKWHIGTRYLALNLMNAICYDHGKTAEFRCLRPSYNFDKILCWIFILAAYIRYAENFKLHKIDHVSVETIICSVYSSELANMLRHFLELQRCVVEAQTSVGDLYGGRVDIEDQILTYDSISQGYKYFY